MPVPAWNPERLSAKAKGEGLRRNGFFRMMGGTAIRYAAVSALRILKCRTQEKRSLGTCLLPDVRSPGRSAWAGGAFLITDSRGPAASSGGSTFLKTVRHRQKRPTRLLSEAVYAIIEWGKPPRCEEGEGIACESAEKDVLAPWFSARRDRRLPDLAYQAQHADGRYADGLSGYHRHWCICGDFHDHRGSVSIGAIPIPLQKGPRSAAVEPSVKI